ncbi:hypothetical protein MPSEU_001042500 [Mayamaea pseudoterrestris]|nr:hypothetical protein MPSEU_001042500 [Mayamaea pseudoterrestris]
MKGPTSCHQDHGDMYLGTSSSMFIKLLVCYVLCGAIHELTHVATATIFHGWSLVIPSNDISFWCHVLLGRQTRLLQDEDLHYLVRHAGWMMSVLLALFLMNHCRTSALSGMMRIASALTALEAISTDLLGFPTIPFAPIGTNTLLCGNFGIIVLHQAWLAHNGKAALDVLEKMIEVTMMRGAQSGGVVTLDKDGRFTRTRVVNQKRTALSRKLRKKLEANVNFANLPITGTALSGHTRFATSSKATMDGTHPQQWSPKTMRKIFIENESGGSFVDTLVENFVTHNGDFEFYTLGGKTCDLHIVQQFLSHVTEVQTPAVVDSCAVAGMLDVLRTKGCFGLSIRGVLALNMPNSAMTITSFPTYKQLDAIASVFEHVLLEMLKTTLFQRLEEEKGLRHSYALRVVSKLKVRYDELFGNQGIDKYVTSIDDEEQSDSLLTFALKVMNSFLDGDLFFAMKTFLHHAKGSFGLCFTSSLDAKHQVCLAARGQTMSVAFYPSKGLICYGSEQAAVKAGMSFDFPGRTADSLGRSRGEIDNEALRLDLDDLGGEVILLDWSKPKAAHPVSFPSRNLEVYELMNGAVSAVIYQESKGSTTNKILYHRLTRLSNNPFIRPLEEEPKDLILDDIMDIPNALQTIQDDFGVEKASSSLNRLTAFHLSRCLRKRLEARIAGTLPTQSIDILLTGCEVSLWVAEQFASDLKNSFPGLIIHAISSNKILGSFGQEIAIPATGFPYSRKTYSLHDSIVIIVSHSGGTFAPLACSNLLQSATRNLFVVTSEWDTQISKQLRAMDAMDGKIAQLCASRIFSTEVGMRPAEPCSISVAATHQLLTNLLQYLAVVILSEERFRKFTQAIITEYDIQILEKCNQMNIQALEDIVGADRFQQSMDYEEDRAELALRIVGDLWANHILENAKAYIMSFIYIFATVISGYPLFFGIAVAAGLDRTSRFAFLIRVLDAATYFWIPQINITIIRLVEGRNVRHRMVGRTVVIGDIPWVAQSAEAFLSKASTKSKLKMRQCFQLTSPSLDRYLPSRTRSLDLTSTAEILPTILFIATLIVSYEDRWLFADDLTDDCRLCRRLKLLFAYLLIKPAAFRV